jgi:hypothetical protein
MISRLLLWGSATGNRVGGIQSHREMVEGY